MPQKTPAISVIIPAYNHALYIGETIQSVLTQTHTDFELLVLDDGSTDDTWGVIEKAASQDSRVTAWRQDNAGVVTTLNRLMERTRAPLVALLGSDDIWLPQRLEWGMVDLTSDPTISAAFCSYLICDAALRPLRCPYGPGLPGPLRGAALAEKLIPHNFVGALTAVVRAEAVRRAGPFARDYQACHDWDLWLRLSMQGDLYLRPDIGALYRWHGKNMSAGNKAVVAKESVDILGCVSPLVARHYQFDEAAHQGLALQTARAALAAQKPQQAVAALIERSKVTRLDPESNVLLLLSLALAKQTTLAKKLADHIEETCVAMPPHLALDFENIKANLGSICY